LGIDFEIKISAIHPHIMLHFIIIYKTIFLSRKKSDKVTT